MISEPSLYLADALTLLDCLKGTPQDCSDAALIGHNPHQRLGATVKEENRHDIGSDLPTLGLVRPPFWVIGTS